MYTNNFASGLAVNVTGTPKRCWPRESGNLGVTWLTSVGRREPAMNQDGRTPPRLQQASVSLSNSRIMWHADWVDLLEISLSLCVCMTSLPSHYSPTHATDHFVKILLVWGVGWEKSNTMSLTAFWLTSETFHLSVVCV